jgi:hypothetical protein
MTPALDSLMASAGSERLKTSSYLSPTYKYLYVDAPKAACTTLKQLVLQIENLSEHDFRQSLALDSKIAMLVHDRTQFRLPSISSVAPSVAEYALTSSDFFRFCFVRNPYARLFSAWQSKVLLREPYFLVHMSTDLLTKFSAADSWQTIRQSFKKFVTHLYEFDYPNFTDAHWRPQSRLLFADKISYDLIGHTEIFAQDVQKLFTHLQRQGVAVENLTLNRSNTGIFRDWRWFYDEDTAGLVGQMYDEDFRQFGFDRNIATPRVPDRPLPTDDANPHIGDWIAEITARNEMIVLLRSRLVEQIDETARVNELLAAVRDNRPASAPVNPQHASYLARIRSVGSRFVREFRRAVSQ